jgi:hypothetical protein
VRHTLATAATLVLLFALCTGVLAAAPVAQDQLYEIASPRPNAKVRGSVEIVGSARAPGFDFYKVEYASSATPDIWVVIGDMHRQERTNERLETWHTSGLPDGAYFLRLMVVRQDGNYVETERIPVQVVNTQPQATPTPEESPTPTPTVVIPTPTTAIVEQPTVVRTSPTETTEPEASPTTPPETGETVSIPSMGVFVRQCLFGAFVAAVLFIFVGIVLLLRRFI